MKKNNILCWHSHLGDPSSACSSFTTKNIDASLIQCSVDLTKDQYLKLYLVQHNPPKTYIFQGNQIFRCKQHHPHTHKMFLHF